MLDASIITDDVLIFGGRKDVTSLRVTSFEIQMPQLVSFVHPRNVVIIICYVVRQYLVFLFKIV